MKSRLSVCALFLAGCAGSIYEPPVGEDMPTVDFQGEYSLLLVYKNGEDCSDGVGIPPQYAPWEPERAPLPVAPDAVFSFQVRQYDTAWDAGQLASATCGGIYSFVPKVETDYRFSFEKKTEGCSVLLVERDRDGSPFAPSPISKRTEKFAMTVRGSVCQKDVADA
ncbi:MAG: hypothetical protein QNJ00_04475 [Woeseiaceae bacterium]|nr:hypothetical protein [Woeseiaceae bacterium]